MVDPGAHAELGARRCHVALLAASPRSAKRDRGCQPGTGWHKGCLGPSPEQRKGARSLALPCLWVSYLLWVPSTWLVPGSRLGARRLLGSALAQQRRRLG